MIYYLGYYSCEQIAKNERVAAPPAMNKMGYIISALSDASQENVMVVSPAETALNRYIKGGIHKISDTVSLKTFGSFNSKNKIIRVLGHILTRILLYYFLLTQITGDDTLIVYHSLVLMGVVTRVRKIKKCKLIIEVEELYSDARNDEELRKKEIDYLQIADKYIIITELLNEQVNLQNKSKIISHGTYRAVPDYGKKFDDGKIHVVYAGSFNPVKGGACCAVEAAEFLDENYVMHILGKGSPEHTEIVVRKVKEISGKSSCEIIYEGYKTGKEYDAFIQSCHIGLSTQQPDGKYNASSFPSKILMYMSDGLPVVSVRIPAVEGSNVGEYIYYYDVPAPQNIAQAIKAVDLKKSLDVRGKLEELDKMFKEDLKNLLK